MCSVSEGGFPQQGYLSPEWHRIQRGVSILSIQGRGPSLPGAHSRRTFIGTRADLPFKVSLVIPNSLMGSTLRAANVAGFPSPRLCLVWVNPNLCGGRGSVCAGYSRVLPRSTLCSPPLCSVPQDSKWRDCISQVHLPSGSWLGSASGKHQQKTGGRRGGPWGPTSHYTAVCRGCCFSPWPRTPHQWHLSAAATHIKFRKVPLAQPLTPRTVMTPLFLLIRGCFTIL